MPTCIVCSGTDFICESGYYFCSECQTQSQDLREELNVHDNAEDEGRTIGGKRRRSTASECSSISEDYYGDNMTSWEGYNFSLIGMINDLIDIGAKPDFKVKMLKLWADYLCKMEVAFFSKDEPALPKLGPNYKRTDANIIYGYNAQKRENSKKIESEDDENDDIDDEAVKKKRNMKRKRNVIQNNYDRIMKHLSTTSQTLTDMTLDMLQITEIPTNDPQPLQMNADAQNLRDVRKEIITHHPGVLTRSKLVSFLFLGLLATDEDIKPSDLLRWIREGHVSYTFLSKYFPADTKLHGEIFGIFSAMQPLPQYHDLLRSAQLIAFYIGMTKIKVPCLKDLIQKYTKELNLPAQVGLLAERLLGVLPELPKTYVTSPNSPWPNWEGRAMAIIIMALKLVFGLDDVTEHHNSRIARRINELIASQNTSIQLFVWDDWEKFCVFRQTAFSLFREPPNRNYKLSTSSFQNINSIEEEWKKHCRVDQRNRKRRTVMMDTYKHFMDRLKDPSYPIQADSPLISFPASQTPLTSSVKHITEVLQEGRIAMDSSEWSVAVQGLNLELLNQNFRDMSIDYLTHPNGYIEWAQQHGLRIGLRAGSAVDSVKLHADRKREICYQQFRVKLFLQPSETVPQEQETFNDQYRSFKSVRVLITPKTDPESEKNSLPVIKDMAVCKEKYVWDASEFGPRIRRRKKTFDQKIKTVSEEPPSKEDEENMLHVSQNEYWTLDMPSPMNVMVFKKKAWLLPQSFVQLLEECASLIEMQPWVVYKELLHVEYLFKDLSSQLSQDAPNKSLSSHSPMGEGPRIKLCKNFW